LRVDFNRDYSMLFACFLFQRISDNAW